jgi:hypothetical protein
MKQEEQYLKYFKKIREIAKNVLDMKCNKHPQLKRESIALYLYNHGKLRYEIKKKHNKKTLKLSLFEAGVMIEMCKDLAETTIKERR